MRAYFVVDGLVKLLWFGLFGCLCFVVAVCTLYFRWCVALLGALFRYLGLLFVVVCGCDVMRFAFTVYAGVALLLYFCCLNFVGLGAVVGRDACGCVGLTDACGWLGNGVGFVCFVSCWGAYLWLFRYFVWWVF